LTENRRSPLEPVASRQGEGHWAAARLGRLALQHCQTCHKYIFYPSFVCDRCLSTDLEWSDVAGRGTVESFTVVHRAFADEFARYLPYIVALVRLEDEINLLTWLVDVTPEDVRIGMPVEVVFERISDSVSLHRFRPIISPPSALARGER
jgi:uncharacterized OB-fold protein